MDQRDNRDNEPHRKRMADSDGGQRFPYRGPPLLLQSKSHRKEPAHPGIYAMEGAQPEQRQPRPDFTHG